VQWFLAHVLLPDPGTPRRITMFLIFSMTTLG